VGQLHPGGFRTQRRFLLTLPTANLERHEALERTGDGCAVPVNVKAHLSLFFQTAEQAGEILALLAHQDGAQKVVTLLGRVERRALEAAQDDR